MAAADVTVTQNGGQSSEKVHPYVLALIRWCLSCVWSAGTLVLHRLMIAPLPSIAGTPSRPQFKPRPAGRDHLHPEPLVECVVLHQPSNVDMDVIFVHGLYGSLSNTWRQGEWRSKYKTEPVKVPLRRSDTLLDESNNRKNDSKEINGENEQKINEDVRADLPGEINIVEDIYVDKDFYEKALLEQVEIIDNYETQAEFVHELFDYENNKYCDDIDIKDNNEYISKNEKDEVKQHECMCKDDNECCEVGCGCICDECYSSCWPRDWISADYPNARVISINYTSDPHLWRPLWIKGSKRLRLHERAEQMILQLLNLGVGQKPIIWVGHSKGGLFIKHIYCEAYEAYLTLNGNQKENIGNYKAINDIENDNTITENKNNKISAIIEDNPKSGEENCDIELNKNIETDFKANNNLLEEELTHENYFKIGVESGSNIETKITVSSRLIKNVDLGNSTMIVDVENDLRSKSTLWTNSAGFMFYSVPHRGSPLADFKTPITARSIELMEICKDCSLVLALQERWLVATRRRPSTAVRSLVETCRTLMSVLWLRIVSVDSADAGIGTLHGVSLDHREICKPSSRRCLLYTELMELIRTALEQRSQ